MKHRPSIVDVANEKVTIAQVCRWVGVDITADTATSSRKVHCPFGDIYHSDHGADAAMRLYPDSNHAYCFSCGYSYTPVRLAARAWDMHQRLAATVLLDRIGFKPVHYAAAFAEISTHTPAPDPDMLAEALKTYCARICPTWNVIQFDPTAAWKLDGCLRLLAMVRTDTDATQWLATCKTVMAAALTYQQHRGTAVKADHPTG